MEHTPHPHTLTMVMASSKAFSLARESGTLPYLKQYRDSYLELAKGDLELSAYVDKLDQTISLWQNEQTQSFAQQDVPMMDMVRRLLPSQNLANGEGGYSAYLLTVEQLIKHRAL